MSMFDHRGANSEFLAATLPHLDAVWGIARRFTPDRSSAEDLVQETYLLAFRSYPDQGSGQLRSWLAAICLNAARSQYRADRRRPFEQLDVDLSDVVAVDDVAAIALARIERSAVAAAIAELPDDQRVAVVLVDIGGLSTQEAADTMGVPRGTVLSRVHRGRRRLAGILARQGLDHGR
ncbi:MAG: RNA polymerase sigma factor [Actinomycetota bacterium]|nr:RNA polymerase sigma factor [Actinomycetota bacterium]